MIINDKKESVLLHRQVRAERQGFILSRQENNLGIFH